jgi:hypothetical protein
MSLATEIGALPVIRVRHKTGKIHWSNDLPAYRMVVLFCTGRAVDRLSTVPTDDEVTCASCTSRAQRYGLEVTR